MTNLVDSKAKKRQFLKDKDNNISHFEGSDPNGQNHSNAEKWVFLKTKTNKIGMLLVSETQSSTPIVGKKVFSLFLHSIIL